MEQLKIHIIHTILASITMSLYACQSPTNTTPINTWEEGEYIPAHRTLELLDTERNRALNVEIWYPSAESSSRGESVEYFETDPEYKESLIQLLEEAPSECTTLQTNAIRNAPPAVLSEPLPLIVFSHCMNCGRYSSFSLAERLASHGMIVLAADHAGPVPFHPSSEGEYLSSEQLETRAKDIQKLIDAALDAQLFDDAPELKELSIDPNKIGAFGHSFGSVSVGKAAQEDNRILAVAGLGAPMDNPLFPNVDIQNLSIPIFFILAQEDNSIGELGNDLLRDNYESANPPVWLAELQDAGHWSVSDLCELTEQFQPGCGDGERHSKENEGESFSYASVSWGINTTQRYLTTFFVATLNDDERAQELLNDLPPIEGSQVTSRLE